MLHPIFGVQLGNFPIYQLMMLIGFVTGWILLGKALKQLAVSPYIKRRIRCSMFWGVLVGLLTANVANWFLIDGLMDYSIQYRLTHGGFTFYFGMMAFLGVSALLLRLRKIPVLTALNAVIPSLLIAHCLGRIGCSLRGCCWGISMGNGHFPARELEATALLALFIIFMSIPKISHKRLPIYLFSYSAFRFIMEFFRGDNRGSLLGITALSPTQLLTMVVVLISGVWLFLRPLLRLMNKEEILDAVCAKRQERRAKKENPYTPLPLDAPKPEEGRKQGVLRFVAVMLVICLLVSSIAVTWNPLSVPVFESIKDGVHSLLTDSRGGDNDIGDSNSASVIPLSDYGTVTDANTAQAVVDTLDQWADAQFTHTATQTLESGNIVYVFQQVMLEKPVLGSERVLVTDAAGNPLYAVGDAAQFAFTDEIAGSAIQSRAVTAARSSVAKDVFADDVQILDETAFLYDTGSGLREVTRVMVSEDGIVPLMGAIVDNVTKTIVAYTDADGKLSLTANRASVKLACAQIRYSLTYTSERQIKQWSNRTIKNAGIKEPYERLTKALAKAYLKAKLSSEEFLAILRSAESTASHLSEVNANVFCDVMVRETYSYLRNNGYSNTKAQRIADKMESAFERSGIKQSKDRAATEITVRERKATHKFYMDFIGDSDVYTLTGHEDEGITLTLQPDTPITVEIYGANGRAVVTTVIDAEQTITLYPEDGHIFTVRVTDARASTDVDDRTKYKMVVQTLPNDKQFPDYIQNTLEGVEDSYNNSNLTKFLNMVADEAEGALPIEEAVAMGMIAPLADSCYACVGIEDGVDTAKTIIAGVLLLHYEDFEADLQYLRGTTMDITCLRYIAQDDTTLVKARVSIRMGDVYLYDGYTFLQMKKIDTSDRYEMPEDPDLERGRAFLARLFNLFVGERHHLIDANTEEILAAFGDSYDSVSADNDLTSLYDLWEPKELSDSYGTYVIIQSFDEEEALADGHSYEKVADFADYTRRHNLMILKAVRNELELMYTATSHMDDAVELVFFGVDIVTNPVGTIIDLKMKNMGIGDLKLVYQIFFDWDGLITDMVKDEIKEELAAESIKMSELCKKQLESVNRWIDEIEG